MKKVCLILSVIVFATGSVPASGGNALYVVNGLTETLSKIDLENDIVHENIVSLGLWPNDIVVRGEKAYVVNSGSEDLYVVDLMSDSLLSIIDLGEGTNPWSAAFSNDNTLYVTNLLTNDVSKVDLTAGQVVTTILVGTAPEGLLVTGNRLFVTNTNFNGVGYDPGTVSVIDLAGDTVTATITVGTNPQDLVLDPQGEINVVCTGDYWSSFGMIYRIDSATLSLLDSIPTGGTPARAAISQFGFHYMAAGGWATDGEVFLHGTLNDVILRDSDDPITTGAGAMDVAVDSEGYMYAASFSGNTVTVFDVPDGYVKEYSVEGGPTAIALSEEPWVEVGVLPAQQQVNRGELLEYTIDINHAGDETEQVRAMNLVVLPNGVPFGGNPVLGPFTFDLVPGQNLNADLSRLVPNAAPTGRYVFFTLVDDTDSRRSAVGSFWFDVMP